MQTHITRRFFVKGTGLLTAAAALAACSTDAGPGQAAATDSFAEGAASPLLAIIHTNDTHGHDVEVKATEKAAGNFSMAAVPALKKDYEDKGYDVLVLDAGDATQGNPLVDNSLGESAIAFMNASGYDLMCLGNHEFDHGNENLKKLEGMAEFPFVSANIRLKETGETRFAPSKLFELADGTKVGVFGLTTPATLTTANPAIMAPYDFLTDDDLFACAQEQVDDLRKQGADLVVLLSHLGNLETVFPNTSKEVLSHVTGIDLVIDGHDHWLVEEEVDGILLLETGCYMKNIGVVVIDAGVPTHEMVAYGTYDGIDAAAQAVIDETKATVDKELSVVFASTPFLRDGEIEHLKCQETNLGDLFCDAILYDAEQSTGSTVDAAVVNGSSLRFPIEAGDITLGDIKTVAPFSGQIMALKITGAQLLEALEAACQMVGTGNKIGAFPQVSGIVFTLNATVPYKEGEKYPNSIFASPAAPGARVTIHTVGDADFDESETYTIATTDFLASGGDTYHSFKDAADITPPVVCDFDYEAFTSYLIGPLDHEVDERYREPQDRITIIEE